MRRALSNIHRTKCIVSVPKLAAIVLFLALLAYLGVWYARKKARAHKYRVMQLRSNIQNALDEKAVLKKEKSKLRKEVSEKRHHLSNKIRELNAMQAMNRPSEAQEVLFERYRKEILSNGVKMYPASDIHIIKRLGKGAFGEVFRAITTEMVCGENVEVAIALKQVFIK